MWSTITGKHGVVVVVVVVVGGGGGGGGRVNDIRNPFAMLLSFDTFKYIRKFDS